jgi:hypothetical protein
VAFVLKSKGPINSERISSKVSKHDHVLVGIYGHTIDSDANRIGQCPVDVGSSKG